MKLRVGLGIALVAWLCSGCSVAYRNFRTGATEPWPPEARSTGWPVAVRVYGSGRYETAPADVDPKILSMWNQEAVRAYRESGLFDTIVDPWTPDAWVAEVSFSVREDERRLAEDFVLFALAFRRSELLMRTRFRNPEGRSLGTVEASESLRNYIDLLVLPLALIEDPDDVLRGAIRDLHRATLAQAVEQGILPSRP